MGPTAVHQTGIPDGLSLTFKPGVGLEFAADGLERLAEVAMLLNERTEDIGARRLHTIMEQVLEEVSFEADTHQGSTVTVDRAFVDARLDGVLEDEDLSRFIL